MQPKHDEHTDNVISKLKRQVRFLTFTSLFLLIVAGVAGYLWQQIKSKYIPPVVIKSGTIDDTMENDMSNAFKNNTSGHGYRNALKAGATDIYHMGIYHRLDTLVSQLSYWEKTLGIDSVDFRFVEKVNGTKSGKFDIIIIPLRKNSNTWPDRTRYPYNVNDKGTWAFDLGDLHP